ncbi:MAG: sarcosine oxidase, subunit alpha [Gaiellales bacterium]|jgi:sarcosine oxidase subunit alpha|nr:sarcosine oxidase, subunit alpha [Gaiellales bacterium]
MADTSPTPRSFGFEGREIPIHPGDTIGSALYRSGVDTVSRSFKYHRRRGFLCMSGDCPNCLVQVDGETGVRCCTRPASDGMKVEPQNVMGSLERDPLALNDMRLMHTFLPVGFYYKTLIKPRWVWPKVEPLIRKVAGLGRVDRSDRPRHLERVYRHPDVVVLGAGPAGLAAALGAAEAGATVIVADEGERPGCRLGTGDTLAAVNELLTQVEAHESIELLSSHRAFGLYEGPEVPLIGPDLLVMTQPKAIVVATGAFESMEVFPGNDVPGVMLGRGAVRLATQHAIRPGRVAVLLAGTHEVAEHIAALQSVGTEIAAVVLPDGATSAPDLPSGMRTIVGEIVQVHGKKRVSAVSVRYTGGTEKVECDLLCLSGSLTPQENLLRQGTAMPVHAAGDLLAAVPVAESVEHAREVGARAARGEGAELPELGLKARRCGEGGYVCICEDVSVQDVRNAVTEGFSSTELLKRYTTITMGPCQGRMCHGQMRTLAERLSPGAEPRISATTTARPPARTVMLDEVTAGAYAHLERRTALHDTHLGLGATFLWAGQWKRVDNYGSIEREYRAVREGVGIIDVATLGKFRVSGPDVVAFLERLYPNHVGDIQPGRLRYGLLLDEHGVIHDDGTICRLDDETFYLTVTTSGAEEAEALMIDWRDTWGMTVHIVNQTAALGAINIAGPKAREVLSMLTDDDISQEGFPYLRQRTITVAGIECLAIRLGFVGEVGWELHHAASRSQELWAALLTAGEAQGVQPFGIQAQRLLRLEKGHIIVSQDTDFETTPWRVDMGWAVKLEKDWFVGKRALVRKRETPTEKLVAYRGESGSTKAPWEGAAVKVGGQLVGRVTSSWYSWTLGYSIGLAWVKPEFASESQRLLIGKDNMNASVVKGAFYDAEGARLRA